MERKMPMSDHAEHQPYIIGNIVCAILVPFHIDIKSNGALELYKKLITLVNNNDKDNDNIRKLNIIRVIDSNKYIKLTGNRSILTTVKRIYECERLLIDVNIRYKAYLITDNGYMLGYDDEDEYKLQVENNKLLLITENKFMPSAHFIID